jgi:hypothetical protein
MVTPQKSQPPLLIKPLLVKTPRIITRMDVDDENGKDALAKKFYDIDDLHLQKLE